jgi:hypothetical protein
VRPRVGALRSTIGFTRSGIGSKLMGLPEESDAARGRVIWPQCSAHRALAPTGAPAIGALCPAGLAPGAWVSPDLPTMERMAQRKRCAGKIAHDSGPRPQVRAVKRLLTSACVLIPSIALLAVPPSAMAGPAAAVADRDCADFDNQAQAQDYFIDRGGPDSDPDRLDADGDGVVCVIYSG